MLLCSGFHGTDFGVQVERIQFVIGTDGLLLCDPFDDLHTNELRNPGAAKEDQ